MLCSMKKRLYDILVNLFFLFLTSVIIFYFVEAIYFQNFSKALEFIISDEQIQINLINLGIIVIFEIIWLLLSDSMSVSFGITALLGYILVIINEFKMSARGEAFTLNDVFVAKEAFMVAGNYNLNISSIDAMVFVLFLVLFIVIRMCMPKRSIRKGKLGLIIKYSLALFCVFIFITYWMNMENVINIINGDGRYIYVTADFYSTNGYLVGIARTTPHKMKAPTDYSRAAIEAIQDTVDNKSNNNNPNVIFIMNESLYDMYMLERVGFSRDPLEKLKKWQEKYAHGNFISPAFGGGTCNVEFEVLTGCPLYEVGGSYALPYSDMIYHNIDSLISLMNHNGYRTTAFHPNTGTYFNRRQIYDYMGFQEVYFSEEMGELPTEGLYTSDLELYNKVIETYEMVKSDEQPFFSYIITMQNHGGYMYDYKKCGIEVEEGGICENTSELQTYANIVSSSVDAMEYFITYFDSVKEPTVVVIFGDHIPAVDGFGYRYDEVKYTEQHVYAMTPLIIYSNYDLPYEDWEYVNGYSLAAKVLEYCGIRMDDFFAYEAGIDNVPSFGESCYIDGQWQLLDTVKSEILLCKKNLGLMAYDRVFGEQYGNWNE